MTFFSKYELLCSEKGILPMSQEAADLIGVERATITNWKKRKSFPKGETLIRIADCFRVSTDYLLGRTSNPEDFTERKPSRAKSKSAPRIVSLYSQLDSTDKIKAEAYVEGILSSDKYRVSAAKKTG